MLIIRKRLIPLLLMHHRSSRLGVNIAMLIFHGHGDGVFGTRSQGYLCLPGGKVIVGFNLVLFGAIDNEGYMTHLAQRILSGAADGELGIFGSRDYVGEDDARCRRLAIFHGADDKTAAHPAYGHHNLFGGVRALRRIGPNGEALLWLNTTILVRIVTITEFVLTIGDADARESGNAGKGNRVALNQLTWGKPFLRRKAKAVGCGYGVRLWLVIDAWAAAATAAGRQRRQKRENEYPDRNLRLRHEQLHSIVESMSIQCWYELAHGYAVEK